MAILTCHTPGCANVDKPLELEITHLDDAGNQVEVDTVLCGPCGQSITDIQR